MTITEFIPISVPCVTYYGPFMHRERERERRERERDDEATDLSQDLLNSSVGGEVDDDVFV